MFSKTYHCLINLTPVDRSLRCVGVRFGRKVSLSDPNRVHSNQEERTSNGETPWVFAPGSVRWSSREAALSRASRWWHPPTPPRRATPPRPPSPRLRPPPLAPTCNLVGP